MDFLNIFTPVMAAFSYDSVLLPLALILFIGKFLSILCKKLGLPQVVGMLIAGILIGLIKYIPGGEEVLSKEALEGVGFIAKIGVILIMFSAGMETDIKKVKATGPAAVLITVMGVVVPMALGFLVAVAFNGGFHVDKSVILSDLFYGVILTATSVSVTVATLKELGKLDSKVGTCIISAAILDDIIGVIVLSLIIGLAGGDISPLMVLLKTILFFIVAIVCGFLFRKLFAFMMAKYDHHRRVPIFGLAVCFLYAYVAEEVFGVADITGAFFAGLFLSGKEGEYIDRRSDIMSYMIFSPVFFANVGINLDFSGFSLAMCGFGACYILAGLAGKFFGCGAGALMFKYSFKDSIRVGLGMMARAEVALICVQKGVDSGLVDSAIMPFVVILIVISSFLTPMFLKLTYKKENVEPELVTE